MRMLWVLGWCAMAGMVAQGSLGGEGVPAPTSDVVAPTGNVFSCDQPVFDFREVSPGAVIAHAFVLQNRSTNTVRILNVRTSCGCTTTAMATNLLLPGQALELTVSLNLQGRSGPQRKTLTVESDDPMNPRLRLAMTGVVINPIEVTPAGVHFGTLARDGEAEREVLLTGRTGVVFKVKEVKPSSQDLTATFETREEGRSYRVKIRSVGPRQAGTTQAAVRVLTDHPVVPELNIPVTLFVGADVVAAPTSLILVQGPTNGMRMYYVGVYSPAAKPFNVIKVDTPGAALTCTVVTISPDRHRLEIKAAGDLSGVNGKALRIETDVATMKELQVPVRVIAGPGAPVPSAP
jgi:hypothetical protein